jgi:hypothetical protein
LLLAHCFWLCSLLLLLAHCSLLLAHCCCYVSVHIYLMDSCELMVCYYATGGLVYIHICSCSWLA